MKAQMLTDEIEKYLLNDMTLAKECADRVENYIKNSDLNAGGNNYTRTLMIPKIYDRTTVDQFSDIVRTTYGIFDKVIDHYCNNEKYRKLFPFSKELESLIMIPCGYKNTIPICRIDLFYNETNGSFKFCEFNTDGTSAMNENTVLDELLYMNEAWMHCADEEKLGRFELIDSWIDAFMINYREYSILETLPYVAIVDFLDKAYLKELYVFERRFRQRGIQAEVCDIRKMRYKNGRLYTPTGHPVDAVYRRAVTSDVMAQYEEIQDFIMAVKQQKICLIGAFKTQIVHHKAINQILLHDMTKAFLTEKENDFLHEHLPATYSLKEAAASNKWDDILKHKDRWIIKPIDSYASKGVYAGVDLNADEWIKKIKECSLMDYIVQEYCMPFKTKNLSFGIKPYQFNLYSNLTGLYTYNGCFKGIYSRMSDGGIISTQYNEKTVATRYMK